MSDIAEKIQARLKEIEELALRASPGPWQPNGEHDEILAADDITVADGFALSNRQLRATVDHIVMHEPTAVLRRCAADREIVAEVLDWPHYYSADPWYSCGLAAEVGDEPGSGCANDANRGRCTCRLEARQARILAPLARGYGLEVGT